MEYFKAAFVMVFGIVYVASAMACAISWSEDNGGFSSRWDIFRFVWGYGHLALLLLGVLAVLFLGLVEKFS